MKQLFIGACLILLAACTPKTEVQQKPPTETEESRILSAAFQAHGSKLINGQQVDFTFRGRQYTGIRNGGTFKYIRAFRIEGGDSIRDVLHNTGFYRMLNGEQIALPRRDSAAYSNSVNSVLYFAYLPYNLTDPAARVRFIGTSNIQGEPYEKLLVTFRQEGGGKDFEDEFVYWFHADKHTLDFLAYNYLTDGGGARFRKAINPRTMGGIRFQDYVNYAPEPDNREVSRFDSLFQAGQMKELSRIELENISVQTADIQ